MNLGEYSSCISHAGISLPSVLLCLLCTSDKNILKMVGTASGISKSMHTSQCVDRQDTTESREPRLNVHTNQILAHTFGHTIFVVS